LQKSTVYKNVHSCETEVNGLQNKGTDYIRRAQQVIGKIKIYIRSHYSTVIIGTWVLAAGAGWAVAPWIFIHSTDKVQEGSMVLCFN